MYISESSFSSLPCFGEREEKELNVYKTLGALEIQYTALDHSPADTMEICELIEQRLNAEICKNLFLCNRQQTDFYLLLMPGKKVFKTKFLSEQINSSRLSFASAEHMIKYLNIKPGAVSVFGLMYDSERRVKLLIDRELISKEYIGCHPCVNTSVLKIKTRDILDVFLPYLNISPIFVDLPLITDAD